MASSTPLCGLCEQQHTSSLAVVWCCECDDGFCTDCSNNHRLFKLFRHHTVTPIENYQKLPANILGIEQFCKEHDERFVLFCKNHDAPCCRICGVKNHKQCQDICKIEEVVQNVKISHVFQETEQVLTELAENIQKIQKDREENLDSIENSILKIEKQIKDFRAKVNDHFDKIQEDIIKELNKTKENERKEIQKMVDELKQKEKDINEIHNNLSNIKQNASDLQAYFGLKQIQNDVGSTVAQVDSIISSENFQQIVLSFEVNTAMKEMLSTIKDFGKIIVGTRRSNVSDFTKMKKKQQAQFLVPQPPGTIDSITLQLKQTLEVDSSMIRGCCILPDSRVVFTDFEKKKLIFMNSNSTHNTTLDIPSGAFGVIYVKYNKFLAVTSGREGNNCITFINIKSNKVKDTIKLNSYCFEIVEKDNMLFYCDKDYIYSLSLTDKSITMFKQIPKLSDFFPYSTYIDIYDDNLYHSNTYTNAITCYNISGKIKWQFKDENIIKGPRGISVDNRGHVYVMGCTTCNVVVISPDGQKCRELLSTKDNLSNPRTIYYDRSKDLLLVANNKETAFLYKVT